MKSDYEQKRQQRIERLKNRADNLFDQSVTMRKRAHDMADVIPFGQPILVGHHSEKRDRRYRAKIESGFRKSAELAEQASNAASRAAAAESNAAISSDDPDAIEKIKARIAKLEADQEKMKATNKIIRNGDTPSNRAALLTMGFTETHVGKLYEPDFVGRLGFPDYALANNRGNITRLKERLKTLERAATRQNRETEVNGVRIVKNADENRLQIFFPGKPDKAVRDALKEHGFRWAPSEGAWQRFLTSDAHYWAKRIVETML
jgi:DNA repair exonuclease SbcCD ATPase subunit